MTSPYKIKDNEGRVHYAARWASVYLTPWCGRNTTAVTLLCVPDDAIEEAPTCLVCVALFKTF